MFLAAALLAFSLPQSAPGAFTSASDSAVKTSTATTSAVKTEIKKEDATSSTTLPAAPAPKVAADDAAPAAGESVSAEAFLPGAGIQPATPPKAALRGPRYEAPKQRIAWIGLSAVGHSAAGFDAYSTRRAISGGYGTESNPLLRPFAHSGALYVATQVSPTVMDFVGHKMMTNRRPWVRKMWWVPQAAGAGFSFAAGMHNMSLVK